MARRRAVLAALVTLLLVASPPGPGSGQAVAAPPGSGPGERNWTVERSGAGWRVTVTLDRSQWRDDVPVLVVDGRRIGIARQSPGGRRFSTQSRDGRVARAREVRLAYSTDAAPGARRVTAPPGPVVGDVPGPPSARVADPAVPGRYPVRQRDYHLGDRAVYLPGIGQRSELAGRLYLPVGAPGRRPVVVLLHGMHAPCYGGGGGGHREGDGPWPCPTGTKPVPNHLGYAAAARTLATQGFVVASISANAVNVYSNGVDDFGQQARGELTLTHLDLLARGQRGRGPLDFLRGRLNLDRVGLMGHSRGGEGVVRAALANAQRPRPYGVRGLFLLAPTDFLRLTAPEVSTAVLLPYCDGDVSDLAGQHILDDTRYSVSGDRSFRSGLLVMGANHNYFNTEWSPGSVSEGGDDWGGDPTEVCGAEHPDRLSEIEQRRVGTAYLTGFLRATLGGERRFLPLFDGSGATPRSAGRAVVRATYDAPARNRRDVAPLRTSTPGARGPARLRVCAGMVPFNPEPGELPGLPATTDLRHPACTKALRGAQAPHWSPSPVAGTPPGTAVGHLTWTGTSGRVSFPLGNRRRDVSGFGALILRMAPDPSFRGRQDLTVRVTDRTGRRADLAVSAVSDALLPLPGTGDLLPRTQLRQVRVPLARLRGIDLRRVRSVALLTNRTTRGSVYLADVAFTRTSLGRSGMSRLPQLRLTGPARVREGPAGTTTRVRLRIGLSRPAPRNLSVRFNTVREVGEILVNPAESVVIQRRTRRVSIPAGRRSVSVSVSVAGNDRFGFGVVASVGLSEPVAGVLSANSRRLVVLEDDPMPTLTLESAQASEGDGVLRFPTRLSEASDAGVAVDLGLVDGTATYPRDFGHPDEEIGPRAFGLVDVGRTTGVVEVPLTNDARREPTETFTAEVTDLFNATPPPGGQPPLVGTIRDDDADP